MPDPYIVFLEKQEENRQKHQGHDDSPPAEKKSEPISSDPEIMYQIAHDCVC